MRISDWSSDVCSSDLHAQIAWRRAAQGARKRRAPADAPGGGVLFIVTDKCNHHFPVVLVGKGDRGTEEDAAPVALAGRIDHPQPKRKSVVQGKSVSVRVSIGGRRSNQKKKPY